MIRREDQALMRRLSEGDQAAMKEVFQEHYQQIYRTIYRFVHHAQVCEDLTQEVFLKVWRKRATITISQSLRGYLTTMAYHEAMSHLRKSGPKEVEPEPQMQVSYERDGQQVMENVELGQRIAHAIEKLPPRCKTTFVLSRFEGKSYKEIGQIMDISVKTVENQMGKALQLLRTDLKDYYCVLILLLM